MRGKNVRHILIPIISAFLIFSSICVAAEKKTSNSYPNERIITYERDTAGRITKVIEQKDGKSWDIISNISYNKNSSIASITYGNGILTTMAYSSNGLLSSLSIGNLKQLTYTRDKVGNITAINDLLDSSKTKTFTYDAIYRLTQAVGPWGTLTYGYDPVGNRITETISSGTTNYTYKANKLTSSSGAKTFTFTYDNNSNMITENQRQYIYNQNQRLIKTIENGKTLGEYLYDGNGQRVKKVVEGKTTYFIYDSSGNLISEMDVNGQVNSAYIYLGNVPIARIDEWWEGMETPEVPTGLDLTPGDEQIIVTWNANNEPVDGYKVHWGTESGNYTNSVDVGNATAYTITGLTNGTTYYVTVTAYADIKETFYYHVDHLGTPILMTAEDSDVVWEGEFLPFGGEYSITGMIENNLRFPGQYYDKEIGKHYNGKRHYDPTLGRYTQRDPVGFEGGINQFIYVGNNPINRTDPSGLKERTICSGDVKNNTGVPFTVKADDKTETIAPGGKSTLKDIDFIYPPSGSTICGSSGERKIRGDVSIEGKNGKYCIKPAWYNICPGNGGCASECCK